MEIDDICVDAVQAIFKQTNMRFLDRKPNQQPAAPDTHNAPGPAPQRFGRVQNVSHLMMSFALCQLVHLLVNNLQ